MGCSNAKIPFKEVKTIPAVIESEDAAISPEEFDVLKEMTSRIDPGTFSWDEMDVWVTTHPSMDPYLEVDRTLMPETRPCMGSITVHAQRPDGKQAHFGVPDFWDVRELHHNPEFWWKDFEGQWGYDKSVKGHRKFNIEQDIWIKLDFCGKPQRIKFRGKEPDENVSPKKKRQTP